MSTPDPQPDPDSQGLEALRQAGQSRPALQPFSELSAPVEGVPLSPRLVAAREHERY